MRVEIRTGIIMLVILLIFLPIVTACDGDDEKTEPIAITQPAVAEEPVEEVVFTIGNLSDLTGPSANAQYFINMALDDLVEYYNEENFIPGVTLEVITYDGQMDPSKDIPGYEWLIEKGAELIWTGVPSTPVTLKSRAEKDQYLIFAASVASEELVPPGYIFTLGDRAEYHAYTLLKWIAENDWDYINNGPAKIGGAGWDDTWSRTYLDSMEEYVKAHPDQFQWEGAYLNQTGNFTWTPEVHELKDCDYVLPPGVMISFVNEYRDAGHTAKFLGTGGHAAFMALIGDAGLWEEIDGMLFAMATRWWDQEDTLVDLAEQLLYENHSSDAEKIMKAGVGYLAMSNLYILVDLLAKTVEAVGAENLDSQAIYEAAQSYSLTVDGITRFSFSELRRDGKKYYAVHKASAADETLVLADDNWVPTVEQP
ncbi:ABC transporter substrate-binding protein [Chloroflexota bacterium]